jgi:hypothetical protein
MEEKKGLCEKCNENLVAHGLQLAFRTALSAYPLDHINCVRHLYKMGACPNTEYNGLTPLCLACWKGTASAVEFLLKEARVNVNEKCCPEKYNALEVIHRRSIWMMMDTSNYNEMIELLFDYGIIYTERPGWTWPSQFHRYRSKLAACRLAQRALARCIRGSVSKDLVPVIVDMVWSTRKKQEWNNQ